MRKPLVVSCLIPCLVLLAGCPKKKEEPADAAAPAASAPSSTPAAADAAAVDGAALATPTAKNAGDVARFAAETKMEDDGANPATAAQARTTPKGGTVVATLKPGADVTKIAEYQDAYLVTFADPKDANTTLMGWIAKDAFTASVPKDAGAKDAATDAAAHDAGPADAGLKDAGTAAHDAGAAAHKCATGEESVTLGAGPVCKKKCTQDKDCKKGPCSVAAAVSGGKATRVCAAD